MKTAIYLRVSTEEQVEKFGLDMQRHACLERAQQRAWDIVQIYSDEGISGTKGRSGRQQLNQMMLDAEEGDFEAVIFYDISRISRSLLGGLAIIDELSQMNIVATTATDGDIDTSNANGRLMNNIKLTIAQWQRDIIVEKTTAGRNVRGRKDGERGGQLPLGYLRSGDGRILIDPVYALIVKRIFAERGRGLSMWKIANGLNESGIETPNGGKWYASSIRSVLANEGKYMGGTRGESEVRWVSLLD